MFNPDFRAFYGNKPYQFIKFEANSKVLFLDCNGDSIGSTSYSLHEDDRSLRLLNDEKGFHRISIDSESQISLVVEGVEIYENDDMRIGEFKLNYLKLNPTHIRVNDTDFELMQTNSEWIPLIPNLNTTDSEKSLSITPWDFEESNSEVKDKNSKKKDTTQHLLRIGDSIIFISKHGNNNTTRLAVTVISNSTLVISNHYEHDEMLILERKK